MTKEEINNLWTTNKITVIDGQDYRIHKMSYGDYFAEPANYRGGERDGFHPKTKWFTFNKDTNNYEIVNNK